MINKSFAIFRAINSQATTDTGCRIGSIGFIASITSMASGIIWTLALMVFGAQIAMAGTISLTLGATVHLSPESLEVDIQLTNKGDEAANEVTLVATISGVEHRMNGTARLQPNGTLVSHLKVDTHPFLMEGEYRLPIHVSYRDNAGTLFILPFLVEMRNGKHRPALLTWKVKDPVLPSEDSVEVALRNAGQVSRKITVSGVLPMGMQLDPPTHVLTLGPGESKSWSIPLKHVKVWPNQYSSYLLAEFEHEGVHYTSPKGFTTRVVFVSRIPPDLFSRKNMTIALLALVMLAAIGGFLTRGRGRSGQTES